MHFRFASILGLACTLFLSGCIRDRAYRLAESPPGLPVTAPASWEASGANEHVHTPLGPSTVAVIEFDEHGRQWPCINPRRLCELERATEMVRDARIQSRDKEVVILTYVHGWHYDASGRSGDLRNFEMMVQCLNWGNPADDNLYDQLHPSKYMSQPPICTGMQADESHRYVGVYIAWHGESIQRWTKFLPYLTVFTRRSAAGRVAANIDKDGVQQTFLELSKAAKDKIQLPDKPTVPLARLIIAGHSYGGLIVGRAAAELFAVRMQHTGTTRSTMLGCPPQTEVPPPFADMIFTINPADNSLRMAELALRFKAVAYPGRALNTTPPINCPKLSTTDATRPLLVSIHTPSDPWTSGAGSMAYQIVFGVDQKEKRQMASAWKHRPDSNGGYYEAETPEELRHNTIHRTDSLQNLCYLDQANGYDPVCAGLNDTLYGIKRAAFRKVMGKEFVPVPANPDYSPDPWYHGAFELLSAVCTLQSEQPGPAHWELQSPKKRHQFAPDFEPKVRCEEDRERRRHREELSKELREQLRPYLAFPDTTGKLPDSLVLDVYRRDYLNCWRSSRVDQARSANTPKGQPYLTPPPPCDVLENVQGQVVTPGDARLWNDTPLLAMNVSYEIIQSHSGFWNSDAISLMKGIASRFPVITYDGSYKPGPLPKLPAVDDPPSHNRPVYKKLKQQHQRHQGEQQR